MRQTTAQTHVEVICDCPYCFNQIDIFPLGLTTEVLREDHRADNIELEIVCPRCKKTFIVTQIDF